MLGLPPGIEAWPEEMISAARDCSCLGAGPILLKARVDFLDAVGRLDEDEAHAARGDRRPVDLP
jgi:hypothetical protein